MIRLFRYIFVTPAQAIFELRGDINKLKELIMATNAELQASLEAINTKLDEAGSEISAKLQELRDLIAASPGAGSTPEIDALVNSIDAKVTALTDVANAQPPG